MTGREKANVKVLVEKISQALSLWLFKGFLWFQSRPSIVKQALAGKHMTPSSAVDELPESGRPAKIRVAAVQMKLGLVKDDHARIYAETIYRLTKEAVEQGAQLVVFPEDSGVPLSGLIPGLEDLASSGLDSAVKEVSGGETKVADVFRLLSPAVKRIYETTFSTLARSFRVYIISGSAYLEDDDGKMRNIGYFFDPDGSIIAKQRKLHLLPLETKWGFEPGRELEVLDTRLGRIAFPICMDATYFETFRIARLRGADIVVIPAANNEEYLFWRTMRGIWPRVQESQVLGVSAHAVGNLIGIPFTGRSGLLGPLELTQSEDGYFTQADTFYEEEVVVGDLNLDALYQFREENPLNFNVRLYEKYLPGLYEKGQKQRTQTV
jgi:predicted amidohydrolase